MQTCRKPIYPVLPSVTTAAGEVKEFLSRGHVNFPDEVLLANTLTRIHHTPPPSAGIRMEEGIGYGDISKVIESSRSGYLPPEKVQQILDAAGIPRVPEGVATDQPSLEKLAHSIGFPLAMKVVGPVHKSDVGGVKLHIDNDTDLMKFFLEVKGIEGSRGVLLQPMLEGLEVFAGASYESGYGHIVMCGLGGIYVEALKDIATGLAPLSTEEAFRMIRSLRGYPMLEGLRGQEGLDVESYAVLLARLSSVLDASPEITEIDLNPIMGQKGQLVTVDARIRIERLNQ
jgi:acetyltransferase